MANSMISARETGSNLDQKNTRTRPRLPRVTMYCMCFDTSSVAPSLMSWHRRALPAPTAAPGTGCEQERESERQGAPAPPLVCAFRIIRCCAVNAGAFLRCELRERTTGRVARATAAAQPNLSKVACSTPAGDSPRPPPPPWEAVRWPFTSVSCAG
jgi:hypothetical protein